MLIKVLILLDDGFKLTYRIVDDDLDILPSNMRDNIIKSIDRNKDAFAKLSNL
jgi:hypothetical protein